MYSNQDCCSKIRERGGGEEKLEQSWPKDRIGGSRGIYMGHLVVVVYNKTVNLNTIAILYLSYHNKERKGRGKDTKKFQALSLCRYILEEYISWK